MPGESKVLIEGRLVPGRPFCCLKRRTARNRWRMCKPETKKGNRSLPFFSASEFFSLQSASVEYHDGFSVCAYHILFFQHFQNTSYSFAGTTDNLTDFLPGDFDLHSIRMSHGVGLVGKVDKSTGNAPLNVKKCQISDLAAGGGQASGHLGAESHQDFRIDLNELLEFLV